VARFTYYKGGVLLSMEKFNKILNIDERNTATVEPGVINYVFQEEVKKSGCFIHLESAVGKL